LHPLIENAKRAGRHLLEPEALGLLEAYGVRVPRHAVVRSEGEALSAARSLGWPVVMKIVSPDILHKTELGGVDLNVGTESQVSESFTRLSSLTGGGKRFEGIIVYPFQKHDAELSVGMVRDAQFGPVITFGLGGIWIEVFRDIAYGLAPLSTPEAEDMLDSIRAQAVLKGARNKPPADREALCRLLVSLSRMVKKEEAIRELDLNPVFPLEKGYFIADARIIL
jgi:succinyl-CoA synthetase beta subunit